MKKLLIALSAGIIILLAGCSEEEMTNNYNNKDHELKKSNKKYDLVYSEMIADSDHESGMYEIAYKDNGIVKYIVKDSDHYNERILKDPEAKPYVVRDPNNEEEVYVYRQPYMIYNQEDDFQAKVKDKSVVK